MSSLLKIRAERDQMSAIERRIADFLLENSHLLRDYSSQALASALGISQSSVVKFSQKLGFKGYPDLKFSIGEELARNDADGDDPEGNGNGGETAAEALWRAKTAAQEETALVNPAAQIGAAAQLLSTATRVLVHGRGEDGLHATIFAARLAQLGIVAVAQTDVALTLPALIGLTDRDVLVVLSEHGGHSETIGLVRTARATGTRVVSVTRHSPNPLRTCVDLALLVSAHDAESHTEAMVFRSAMQHLLDTLILRLWQSDRDHREHFAHTRERLQSLENP